NPSLMLAAAKDPMKELTTDVREVKVAEGEPKTLVITSDEGPEIRMVYDPQTHLLRNAVYELKPLLEKQGAPDVKQARITIDYTQSKAGGEFAEDAFAWTAPAGATDIAAMQKQQQEEAPAAQLKGKDAPAFKLKTLEGKEVTLES